MLNFRKRGLKINLIHTPKFKLRAIKFSSINLNNFSFKKLAHNRQLLFSITAAISILGIIASILLPAIKAHAEQTLTWTTNADFAYNKVGGCLPTSINGVESTGTSYTDSTCAQSGQDSSLKLALGDARLGSITQVAAKGNSVLALSSSGEVWAFGDNSYGQLGIGGKATLNASPQKVLGLNGVGYLSGVTSISTASNTTCAAVSGKAYCWGYNYFGQLGNGVTADASSTIPVAVDTTVMTGTVTEVSVNGVEACAIADGKAYCWGTNYSGQLGDGSTIQRTKPVAVNTSIMTGTVTHITAGEGGSTCAIAASKAYCWGANSSGQLGDTTTTQRTTPVTVNTALMSGSVTSLSAGNSFACAVSTGKAYCWGDDNFGKLGINDGTSTRQTPTLVNASIMTGTVTEVSAGTYNACAIADSKNYCWGMGSYGNLGNNDTANSYMPVEVSNPISNSTAAKASVFSYGACATYDTKLYCWGYNSNGQLGNKQSMGDLVNHPIAASIANTTSFNSTSVVSSFSGGNHTCAINDGKAYCWGIDGNGQVGDGNTQSYSDITAVNTSVMTGTVTAIAAGSTHTCAVAGGKAYCWGVNSSGQLGDGSTTQRATPVAVTSTVMTGTVTAITASVSHTCAIAAGKAYCWGYGAQGALGNGSTSQSTVPVAVTATTMTGTVTDISSHGANPYTCAVAAGKAYCWGTAGNGQLGNGSTLQQNAPVAVTATVMTGTVTAISTGTLNACAVAAGKAYCWGYGAQGSLGNGSTSQTNVPVAVSTSPMSGTVTAISVGNDQACAVASGSAYCWGYNNKGQLGDGTINQRNTPVLVYTPSSISSVSNVVAAFQRTYLISNDGAYSFGNGAYNGLGYYGYNPSNAYVLTALKMTLAVTYDSGYTSSGNMSQIIADVGQGKKTKWYTVGWNTTSLPAGTSVSFSVRTSDDKTNWSSWSQGFTQSTALTTSGSGDLQDLAMSRYAEVHLSMASADNAISPEVTDFSLSFLNDTTAPTVNATGLKMYKQKNSTELQSNNWTNQSNPYFNWTSAEDNNNGSGIQGYCLYLGQDQTANPVQAKGILGASPLDVGGACQYAVSTTELDLGTVGTTATDLSTSNNPYYLLVKAIDYSGNIYQGSATSFAFRFDNTAPKNPFFVSAPSQFVSVKDVTLTWPTTGGEAASDDNSGLAGLQYRVGSGGTWYGSAHNGAQNYTDLLSNSGSYRTDSTYDYPGLSEGNNIFYFRTYDNAGNVSESHITAVVKINTSSPSSPQNVTATPGSSSNNSFAFSWLAPASHVGTTAGMTYCYTVNTLPSTNSCTYTDAGQTSLPADSFATQPGNNTFYVVARDEAGNVNFDTYASTTFVANTSAPGIPKDFEVADVSTKASSIWKIALSWSAPEDVGAGVSKYAIFRSTNDTDYSQVATTSGLSYVDGPLVQKKYYYKIRSCDSANNCGAFVQSVSMTPTGRYTTPPELVGSVSSEVGTRSAKFSWMTDRDADSRIQYGTASGVYLAGEVTVSEPTKAHSVDLYNLEAGTTYYYRVKWTDEDGNTGVSSELTFTTLPAPSVKDVSVIKKGLSSALIQFTSVDATKIELLYGKSDGFGGLITVNTSRSESTYTVELTGLDDGATYLFKLNTFDSDGYKYDSHRTDSFATPPRPRISNLRFQPIDGEPTSTQKVTWTTNVPTDSTVTYGKSGTNGTDTHLSELKADHEMIIKGLEDDSDYFLLAQGHDQDGNLAVSDRQFFRTALDTRPPEISDIRVTTAIKGNGSDAHGQIVVYWKTDEPATSQVAYAFGASGNEYPNRTSTDAQLTTEHVVIVSDLAVSNVFHLQPVSSDKSGNITTGEDKSAVIGRPTDSILNIILNSIQGIFGL